MWPFKRKAAESDFAPAAPAHRVPVSAPALRQTPRFLSGDYAAAAEERVLAETPAIPISPAQLDVAWGLGPTRSGVQINEQTALTCTAVFAATRILSEAIAMLPLKVFEGDEDTNEHQVAPSHPLYPVLRREPNPEMTAATFKELLQSQLCLWGNAYARIVFDNGGNPRRLLPLTPSKVRAERFAGKLQYVVDGGGGRLDPEEVIHIPGLSYDGIHGLSPIGLLREAIALGKAAELFGATFFGNGAHMLGMMSFPQKLTPEQKSSLRETMNRMHQGVGNSHRFLIADGGGKYERIGIPPNEAQFLETRQFQVIDIARMYRIPPHMMGDLAKAGYASIEQMSLEFLTYTLAPWLTKFEQEFTRKLFGASSGFFAKFETRQLLRADHAAKQNYYASGRQWGYLSVNDVRSQEDLPPIAAGDVYLQPVNMAPAGAPPPTAPPPAGQGDRRLFDCVALRGVFEDAFCRMLRRETHALRKGNGKAPEAFYGEHAGHVRDALRPAATSMCALLNRPGLETRIDQALNELAGRRHAQDIDVAATAAFEARELMTRLAEICK